MQTTDSRSASRAEAILTAWTSGDLPRFHREVDSAAGLPPEDSNTHEMERMELLNGVAGELRRAEARSRTPIGGLARYASAPGL